MANVAPRPSILTDAKGVGRAQPAKYIGAVKYIAHVQLFDRNQMFWDIGARQLRLLLTLLTNQANKTKTKRAKEAEEQQQQQQRDARSECHVQGERGLTASRVSAKLFTRAEWN